MGLFAILHIIVVVAVVLRILSRGDMVSTTRLAWILVIILFPIGGVLLYFLFGEVNLGITENKKADKVYNMLKEHAQEAMGDTEQAKASVMEDYYPAFAYASSINGLPITSGNKAEVMPDAETARRRLVEDMDNAKKSINVMYYIWVDDETGRSVADALIRASKRGVKCRAMVDAMGSRVMLKTDLFKRMSEAGVETVVALPYNNILKTLLTSRIDLRNHRKITVIDSEITYCGSQNCADYFYSLKPKYAPWVDILLRFEGPVVAQNQLLFASDWLIYHPENLDDFEFNLQTLEGDDGFPALVWGDGPTIRSDATPQMLATLIGQAQHTLTISTPYFVPGDVVLQALCAAAYRGVDVTMIVPAKNDSWVVAAASRSHYGEMLEAGIKIYEYEGGLLHSKTMVLDHKVALIGSTNLDLRSFDLNYENNILLQDEDTTKAIEDIQNQYLQSSKRVTDNDVKKWGLPTRIWHNVVNTVGPIL